MSKDTTSKKMLLIFPPQWTPISPHFAVPALVGQLKSEGYSAFALDLNIDFFNSMLTQEKLLEAIKKAAFELKILKKDLLSVFSKDKKANEYTFEEQIFLYRYNKIKTYTEQKSNYFKHIPNLIEEAKNTIKSEGFYNPIQLIQSMNIVDKALEILSLPYTPLKIEFEGVQNPFFKFNLESIKYFVFDKTSNIFIDYFNSKLDEILAYNADFIAISLNSSSQIVAGLTLTHLLKQKTKAHINIGGNFFGRIADELKRKEEFFELFCDSVSVEEGEGPILETAKFINGKIPIEEVKNLLYFKDGEVYQNEKMTPVKLNYTSGLDFDDYDFSKYFSPIIVTPYQASRGCYWGKCSFCDQGFGQNFNVKDVDKIIDEFKKSKEKYNINHFEFIDESVSPSLLEELASKIKENNLDIKYFFDARLENGFSKELLKKAHLSGLKIIMWGLESGSRKVMDLINKGIDFDKRFEILKNSKEAGIWNFAFIFFGFPTETQIDAEMTIDMLAQNSDIIHSYGRSVFTMGRHAKLADDPQKYGITKIYPAEEEFSPNINFNCIGLSKKELSDVLTLCKNKCALAYNNPLWMYLRYREWLFLYISKYGADWVKTYDIKKEAG